MRKFDLNRGSLLGARREISSFPTAGAQDGGRGQSSQFYNNQPLESCPSSAHESLLFSLLPVSHSREYVFPLGGFPSLQAK